MTESEVDPRQYCSQACEEGMLTSLRNTLAPIITIFKKFLLLFKKIQYCFMFPFPIKLLQLSYKEHLTSFCIECQHTCLKLLHIYLKHEYPLLYMKTYVLIHGRKCGRESKTLTIANTFMLPLRQIDE